MSGLTLLSEDEALEQRLANLYSGRQPIRRLWAETWSSSAEAAAAICAANPLVVAVGPDVDDNDAGELLRAMDVHRPDVGVVVFRLESDPASTLELMRQGAREVIDLRTDQSDRLQGSLDRVFSLASERIASQAIAPQRTKRVIAVLSPKGGTGKTTMATNLAVGLARRVPGQVLLVDLDVQFGDVASALGLVPEHSLKDAVGQGHGEVDLTSLKVFLTRHESGLAVLSPPDSLIDAEDIDVDLLKSTLATLTEEFPYIVLDTAAGIDDYALVALEFATDLLLVSTTDVPSIRALAKQVDALDRLSLTTARRTFVLNRSDAKVGLSQTDIEATVGMEAAVSVPSSRAVPLSTNQGVPHIDSASGDGPARAFQELVDLYLPEQSRDRTNRRFLRKGR